MVSGNSQGQFLRAVRDRAQMSQRQLAQLTGYSDGWIQNIEAGRRRANPDDLGKLALHLGLSSWERQYLFALGGKMAHTTELDSHNLDNYLETLNPHPAAYLNPAWTVVHANSEFNRIFKGIWLTSNFAYWHYVGRQSRDIMLDWQSSSDWLVSWLRYSLATSPEDQDINSIVHMLMPIKTFAEQWERNIIPSDPATRPWTVYDVDNDVVLNIDMRAWRAGMASGIMLLGLIQEIAPASTAP